MRNYFEENEAACGIHPLVTGRDDPMLAACIVHDKGYEAHQQGIGNESKEEVDKKFYNNMSRIAERASGWTETLLKIQREIYYGLVRVFGWISWNKKRN